MQPYGHGPAILRDGVVADVEYVILDAAEQRFERRARVQQHPEERVAAAEG